jgi:hypothetical protein
MVTNEDREKIQQALDNLYMWAVRWGMEFNIPKCKVMHLGAHNSQHEYDERPKRNPVNLEGWKQQRKCVC